MVHCTVNFLPLSNIVHDGKHLYGFINSDGIYFDNWGSWIEDDKFKSI